MKNIIINLRVFLTFSWFILSLSANAQVFDPSTIWYQCRRNVQDNVPGACQIRKLDNSYFNGDTLISQYIGFPGFTVKQIGNRVYFNDRIIYDFDLKVKDTMWVPLWFTTELIPFVVDSIKTEFVLGKNRKAMYFKVIFNDTVFSYHKQISGIGSTPYDELNVPRLDRFKFDYAFGERWLVASTLGELSHIKIDNQLIRTSDCFICDQLVPTKEESLAEISIKPNPVTDYLHVNTSSPIKRYEVYNLAGQVLLSDTNKQSESRHSIDVSSFTKGLYFIKLNFSSGGSKVFKFLKE